MGEWIKNFFDNNYSDGLGEGMFGHRHLIWVVVTIISIFVFYFLFRKHKKAGRLFMIVVSAAIFLFRLTITIHRLAIKLYEPNLLALPWHMCSLLAFLLPLVIIFDLKKLKTVIYSTSIMGGFITLVLGDYFDHSFINIYLWESMITHSFLIILPLIDIAIAKFKFNVKDSWQTVIGMLFFLGWATLANDVIFKGLGLNYMYLKYNALPFSIGNIHFFIIYVLLTLIFFSILFGMPHLYRTIQNKKKLKILENK